MTLENLEKHHARLIWLSSGEFTERDFDYKIAANENEHGGAAHQGEGGWSTMGDFVNKDGQKRKDLIVFKAKKALKIFERKYPQFIEKEKPGINEEKPKSKEKK